MFSGAITALVTPFRDNHVDADRLRENIEYQIREGIQGVVPCGTTGESPTLSHEEQDRVIEEVVAAVNGRVPVIAGTGSNSTEEALRLTRHAAEAGADASLQVNPYYNKPTQEGMYRHFVKIADEGGLPVILYNIPGRTGVALTPATIARLAEHPRIVGVKEATGSMDSASEIAARCDPERFTILSGDDSMTLPMMAIGGKGVISVLSNLMPGRIRALTDAALDGGFATARQRHLDLFELCRGMLSLATNPIPIKTAMQLAGMDTGEMRLPLCEMDPESRTQLEHLLREQGVLAGA